MVILQKYDYLTTAHLKIIFYSQVGNALIYPVTVIIHCIEFNEAFFYEIRNHLIDQRHQFCVITELVSHHKWYSGE